ncbi:MAG: ATP-binding cassette domain-containing protein [Anaeroplasma sp.]
MITLNNISIKYDKEPVINNFTYQFNDTGIYAIKGESGSGKTTLLNAIAGIVDIYEGEILYSKEIANLAKSISLIFQENNLFDELSVYDNIKVLTAVSKINPSDEEIDVILDKMKIKKYKKTLVANLSGGERQRVSIAIALLLDKKVIIADEPFSSLDEVNSKIIADIFKELAKERLIIFSSHNTTIINEYCDNIIDLMNYGCKNINNNENLLPANDEKNNLDFKTFRFINKKIIKTKKGNKTIISILIFILFSILAFTLSINLYSKERTTLKFLAKENINSIYVHNIKESELKSNLKNCIISNASITTNSLYKVNKNNSSQYFNTNLIFNNFIIDNSLNDNEVILTDYSIYQLNYHGVIRIHNAEDAIGTNFLIRSQYYVDGKKVQLSLTIKDVIITEFSDYYKKGKELSWSIKNEIKNCYQNIILNENTYYKYEFNFESFSISTNYNKNFVYVTIKEELTGNEIEMNYDFLNLINETNSTSYSIGDSFVLELTNTNYPITTNEKITLINTYESIKDFNQYYEICISDELYKKYQEQLNRFVRNTIGYCISFDSPNDVSSIINYSIKNDYKIEYFGYFGVEQIFGYIDLYQDILAVIITILIVLSMFLILYSVLTTYKLNSHKFSILLIYGSKKSNELILLLFDLFIPIISATIFGGIGSYLLNSLFDFYIKLSVESRIYIPTFNFISIILSSIFIIMMTIISLYIGYIISSKKIIKTHI